MMRIFSVQLRKELWELWHTRKLIVVLAVMIGFGFMSPIFAKIAPDLLESMGEGQTGFTITIPEPSQKDAVDQFIKNMSQFGLLLAVLMTFGAIVGERERGQAALMFPHPLPREIFVLAKFAALAILFGIAIALSALAAYIYTIILFDAPNFGGFIALVGLIYLWLLSLVGLSLLASTLGRTMTAAGGIAFAFLLVFLLLGTFTNLAPDKIMNWGRALALDIDDPARWGALIVTLALTVLSVAGSAIILRRQEIG